MKLWNWERRKDDLAEELEAHLRMAVADRVAQGEPLEDARAAAVREMGNPPLVADVTRGEWGWEWLERLWQDVRYAMRQLRKSPGYTITALLTLAIAVGANTAIFGLFYALLLRSLPVERPDQIVQLELQLSGPNGAIGEPSPNVSDGMFDLISNTQTSFSGMCGWQHQDVNLHEADGTRPVSAASLTGGCMRMLGVHAALGRLLEDADDKPGGLPEGYPVVLGYDYWRTHFGADPKVIGRVMEFGAGLRAAAAKGIVVGVMQPGFDDVEVGGRPDIYVPLEMTDAQKNHNLSSFDTVLLGRLKDGVQPQSAQAEADTLFQAKRKTDKRLRYFTFVGGKFVEATEAHVVARPGRAGYSYLRFAYEKPLYLMEGMVASLLLVACAFLAMLATARAQGRRRELAVRMALGASRSRVAVAADLGKRAAGCGRRRAGDPVCVGRGARAGDADEEVVDRHVGVARGTRRYRAAVHAWTDGAGGDLVRGVARVARQQGGSGGGHQGRRRLDRRAQKDGHGCVAGTGADCILAGDRDHRGADGVDGGASAGSRSGLSHQRHYVSERGFLTAHAEGGE